LRGAVVEDPQDDSDVLSEVQDAYTAYCDDL